MLYIIVSVVWLIMYAIASNIIGRLVKNKCELNGHSKVIDGIFSQLFLFEFWILVYVTIVYIFGSLALV